MAELLFLLLGVFIALLIVYWLVPRKMINTQESLYDFDTTVAKIVANAEKEGWGLQGIKRIDESIEKANLEAKAKVALIEICHPEHASKMINDPKSTHISVMMPCTISVYETEDKKVIIATMNIKPMSWMFGGTVKEVMGGPVYKSQKRFIDLN
ncbi:uncharacterized protein (DUF302 family) [Balneicella halophila]|uniref:Uncharacterized protein (DUF302 family) n=1 Tax=Balneicella halophila TaxID=1537566 RepID=A0A7L4UQT0_BALHA|nr:DUF302 domain-containing protein [Balneicella halophila]PVX52126.1 uncharacterized protein (DUF302 family) [Balneicella halophila]